MALEPSQGMVEQAKKKNVYKEFIMELMGKDPTSIKEGTFKYFTCFSEILITFTSRIEKLDGPS